MSRPFVARVARDLVVVEGPDATSFLQSLVSQDLDPVAVGESVHVAAAAAAGQAARRLLRAARRADDEWWCVCEGGFGAALADGLNRFKIRVKVEIASRRRLLRSRCAGLPVRTTRRVRRSSPSTWVGADAFDAVGAPDGDRRVAATHSARRCVDADRVRAGADRGRRAAAGRRHRRADDPARGGPRAGRGVVHEGLLRRPGARVPDRHAGPREPQLAAAPGGGWRARGRGDRRAGRQGRGRR